MSPVAPEENLGASKTTSEGVLHQDQSSKPHKQYYCGAQAATAVTCLQLYTLPTLRAGNNCMQHFAGLPGGFMMTLIKLLASVCI